MTDQEALTVLAALADEPYPRLQEGVRVRWTGFPKSEHNYTGVVTRRRDGLLRVDWDRGMYGLGHCGGGGRVDRAWLDQMEVLP